MDLNQKIFGTDGVRGMANRHPMTVEMAMAIGQGVATTLKGQGVHRRIIIGKDTRLSGYMFENALLAGILSMGVDASLVGPLPTPAIAFITRNMRAEAGIVISASHNSYEDNGIKIFGGNGFKLPDEIEAEVEAYAIRAVSGKNHLEPRPTADHIGKAMRIEDAPGRYIVFLKHAFPADLTLDGVRIAVDCAHGATYKVAPAVLGELGADLTVLGNKPDGKNINQDAGSLHPEGVAQAIKEGKADIGLAFDGDGDRLIMVDEKGRIVDGDHIMAICAEDLMTRGSLGQAACVGTVMSNLGLEMMLRERGIRLLRTKVGDRYVVEAMRTGGYTLGGEQSGHIIFLEHNTTGDGILCALQVLKVMIQSGKPLSELADMMTKVPQILVNLRVKEKKPLAELKGLTGLMNQIEDELGEEGRILVRYSGTEPLFRIMVEALDQEKMQQAADRLSDQALAELGAA